MKILKTLMLCAILFLFCSKECGIGIAQDVSFMTFDPVPLYYTKSNDTVTRTEKNRIVDTLKPGDTVKVLKWYYDKDFVVFKVSRKKQKGYLFGNDHVAYINTGSPFDLKK
jgi:hypothetical protein